MEIICMSPGRGKTTELIKMCAEYGGYIVCANRRNVENVQKMAKRMGHRIPYPMTFRELLDGEYRARNVQKVYIDDADRLIKELAGGVEVKAVTMSDCKDWHFDPMKINAELGARWR